MSFAETTNQVVRIARLDQEAIRAASPDARATVASLFVCLFGYSLLQFAQGLLEAQALDAGLMAGAVGAVIVLPLMFIYVAIVGMFARWLGGSGHPGLLWRPLFLGGGGISALGALLILVLPAVIARPVMIAASVYLAIFNIAVVRTVFSISWLRATGAALSSAAFVIALPTSLAFLLGTW